ncbi:MAG: CorA family divalent cation transporter [Candidatus Thermoplasmatota archaeon]
MPGESAREIFVVALKDGRATRTDAAEPTDLLAPLLGADIGWVNVEVDDLAVEGERVAAALGFPVGMVQALLHPETASYDDRDTELGFLVPMIRVDGMKVTTENLVMILRGNFVVTMYQRGRVTRFRKFARYAETALRKLKHDSTTQDKLTILVTRLLNENNERNFDGIRPIEDNGERLSGELVKENADRKRVAQEIYQMKRALIAYLDALWSSLDVIHYLRHGDAELISDEEPLLARVAILGDDVHRHINLSEHMSEVLSSGLEVMQGIYNNQLTALNNRMAFIVTWLTVLGTAVLVPNTLATVISAAPIELHIEDPLLYIAVMGGSTVLATGLAWIWVRRRVPLGRKLD